MSLMFSYFQSIASENNFWYYQTAVMANISQDSEESIDKVSRSGSSASSFEAWLEALLEVWLNLDFQIKLLMLLLIWLMVNLVLIRLAWRMYGSRLSEILMKGTIINSIRFNR